MMEGETILANGQVRIDASTPIRSDIPAVLDAHDLPGCHTLEKLVQLNLVNLAVAIDTLNYFTVESLLDTDFNKELLRKIVIAIQSGGFCYEYRPTVTRLNPDSSRSISDQLKNAIIKSLANGLEIANDEFFSAHLEILNSYIRASELFFMQYGTIPQREAVLKTHPKESLQVIATILANNICLMTPILLEDNSSEQPTLSYAITGPLIDELRSRGGVTTANPGAERFIDAAIISNRKLYQIMTPDAVSAHRETETALQALKHPTRIQY